MMYSGRTQSQRGFSLLEVLVAIVVFAVGLLAIASLQGNLMQSGSDAKARTVASSLAEEQIEELRTFLDEDVYDAAAGSSETITEGGVDFERDTQIADYYYSEEGNLVAGTDPETGTADTKLITVTVSWCDAQAGSDCNPADMGTNPNTVVVEDVVSRSASPIGSAKALAELTPSDPPRLPYDPGDAPETISIDLELDDNTRKESPQPALKTTRGGSEDSEAEGVNTVTRLESITYNTPNTETQTVQRQEFLAANCTCEFGADPDRSDQENIGHTPVFWDGNDWVGRIPVEDKPVGHFPNDSNLGTQLNVLCSTCCRDHHDGGTQSTFEYVDPEGDARTVDVAKYNPFRDAGLDGDHAHFDGSLSDPVTSGEYLEACRFARVDGQLLLTTDFRLESLEVLPATTTDDSETPPFENWIDGYREFVTDFVEIYAEAATESTDYPAVTPEQDDPETDGVEEGPLPHGQDSPYNLPTTDDTPTSTEIRTLVARAIYIDYLHPILQDRIECRLGGGTNCLEQDSADDEGNLPALLPILPFYEVNVALQANWAEVLDNLVDVSDEPVADAAEYSRGDVTLNDGAAGETDVVASIEQGNIGLTDTHDIAPFDCQDPGRLFIDSLTYGEGASGGERITVSGCLQIDPTLIEGDVIAPSDVLVEDPFGNSCGTALGDNFYECRLRFDNGTDNTITVSNYSTNQTNVKICLGPIDGGYIGGTVTDDGRKSETVVFDFGQRTEGEELTMFIEEQTNSAKDCPPGQIN